MASLIEEELRDRLERQGREHTQDVDRLGKALVRLGHRLADIGQVEGKERSVQHITAHLHAWEDDFRREVRAEMDVARYTGARLDECQTALYLAGEARTRQPEVTLEAVKRSLQELLQQVESMP